MATRRKKPAAEPAAQGPAEPAAQDAIRPTRPEVGSDVGSNTYDQALRELGIDVPVAACRLVGNRLEFRLYGGRVLYWPPDPPPAGEKKKGK